MKILEVKELAIPEVKTIKFERFTDFRGYFTETYRRSDFSFEFFGTNLPDKFVQANETWSRAGTFRGLHFQWNPYMGKLVRCISGWLIDFALDIRIGSPTFGNMVVHDMVELHDLHWQEWIWIPPGFAHGTLLVTESVCEYFCTGGYNGNCEAGISVFDTSIKWLFDKERPKETRDNFLKDFKDFEYMTAKDRNALTLDEWKKHPAAKEFKYENLR